jgi:hypothetical protein
MLTFNLHNNVMIEDKITNLKIAIARQATTIYK